MNPKLEMDEVDAKQQAEIHDLQKKDVSHDRDLWWAKILIGLVWTWSIFSIVVILYGMEILNKTVSLLHKGQ